MTDKKEEVKKDFGLATVKKEIEMKSKEFLSDLQGEIIEEEQGALKEFIKGAYRFGMEKEKEANKLIEEVESIKLAVEEASKGNWDLLQKINMPTRFFSEDILRKHGKSLIEGSSEIRFLDLYDAE